MKPIAIAIVAGLSVYITGLQTRADAPANQVAEVKAAAAKPADVKPDGVVPAPKPGVAVQPVVAQPAAVIKIQVAPPAQGQPAPAPPAVQPAVQPAVVRAVAIKRVGVNTKAQRDAMKTNVMKYADGGTYKMNDIVRFSMAEGKLKAEWVGNFPAGQRRIKIEGSDATYVVTQYNQIPNTHCTLIRYDFDAPDDDFWTVSLTLQGQSIVSFNGQGGDTADAGRVFFTQQPTLVSINVTSMENGQFKQAFNARASDFLTLRAEHADEVRRYLAPLVRRITGLSLLQPGDSDIYRVFTQIPADPKVTSRIEALLPLMISSESAQREKAAAQLAKLGAPGALAALRYDPNGLAPEQQSRLDDLIQAHSRMVMEDPAASLADADFLLDCVENDDRAIRTLAKEALEKVLGRKVEIDPDAVGKKRDKAVDAVRKQLAKSRKTDEKKDAAQNAPVKPLPQILPARGNAGGILIVQ